MSKPNAIDPELREFAAGLAHELSNTLNGVGLHTDMALMMLERGEVEALRKTLRQLQVEFRRNIDLMNALRRFAVLPGELSLSPVAVDTLLAEAKDAACLLLDADPARIRIQAPTADARLRLDAEAITSALVQLTRNAFEAGAGEVCYRHLPGRGEQVIEVEDDGPGMPDELRARLFDMFGGTRRGQGQLGLGLWAVRRICLAHGGRVEAEDGVDRRGARLRLLFADG